jgi:hypothetical protein
MCPSDRVAQLHPLAPGSLVVPFYDSQGCCEGIVTRLHTGHNGTLLEIKICIIALMWGDATHNAIFARVIIALESSERPCREITMQL